MASDFGKSTKNELQATRHTLAFDKLSPADFERLCFWLVEREGYERAEYLGEAGNDNGRDVVAWHGDRRAVFQCKRVQDFGLSHAKKEIAKLRALPPADQPYELVFVVSKKVPADLRQKIRDVWGDERTCQFWAGAELDLKVKSHPDLLHEFWQLTFQRNEFRQNLPISSIGPLFLGRDDLMATLTAEVRPGRATALVQAQTFSGLGGIGKTRLAIEFAWQHQERFTAIFFVNAASASDLRRGLATLAGPHLLDLPLPATAPEEQMVKAVLAALADRRHWLLILDNVDSEDAQIAVRKILPLAGGQVVITSRLQHWPLGFQTHRVDLLEPKAAQRFLLEATVNERRRDPEDENLAADLAQRLGFLPLALELSAAFLRVHSLGFRELLAEWQSDKSRVLGWYDSSATDYPLPLVTTFGRTFERLSPTARALLNLVAHLAPEPIPAGLVEGAAEVVRDGVALLAANEVPTDLAASLVELSRYSLVRRESESLIVHRLVQEVAGQQIATEDRRIWVDWTLEMINAFAPVTSDVPTWSSWVPLLPHAERIIKLACASLSPGLSPRLQNELGWFFYARALYQEAEPLMRGALEIDLASFGKDHPNVATDFNNLAQLLHATNRLTEAEPLMRQALEIDLASFGKDHPNVAIDLNNLAQLLKATNRLTEAEPLMRQALEIDLASFGKNHPRVATHLNNLAGLLQAMNRLTGAEPLMRRALEIDLASFGKDHPRVAIRLNNLALLLQDTNRQTEAEPLMRRAFEIFESSFGVDHPSCVTVRGNLAMIEAANLRDIP